MARFNPITVVVKKVQVGQNSKSLNKKYKPKLKWINCDFCLFERVILFNSKLYLFHFDDLQLLFASLLIFGQYVINIICTLTKL